MRRLLLPTLFTALLTACLSALPVVGNLFDMDLEHGLECLIRLADDFGKPITIARKKVLKLIHKRRTALSNHYQRRKADLCHQPGPGR